MPDEHAARPQVAQCQVGVVLYIPIVVASVDYHEIKAGSAELVGAQLSRILIHLCDSRLKLGACELSPYGLPLSDVDCLVRDFEDQIARPVWWQINRGD